MKKLSKLLTDFDLKSRESRGRSLFRRLNRTEYENTLRDLFSVPVLNVRELLPEDGPSLDSKVHEFNVWLNAGDQVAFNAASLWPFRVSESPGSAAEYVGPGIAIDWLEVEGPFLNDWPVASHQQLFAGLAFVSLPKNSAIIPPKRTLIRPNNNGVSPPSKKSSEIWTVASAHPMLDAERLLTDFLPRAFRRPIEPQEVTRYAGLVNERLSVGHCFETAMRTAYKTALCSPDFLFIRELPGPLDDYALASRLSYFLWNSMPDDSLFELARNEHLQSSKTLTAQVKRMLDDPKSDRFVDDFLDQWLNLREIDSTMPDRKHYPEFHLDLHHAMLGESRKFFRELLQKNESTTAIIDSDFSMLNQRLKPLTCIS